MRVEAVKAAHNAVAVAAAAMAEVEKTARWQWRGRRSWRGGRVRERAARGAPWRTHVDSRDARVACEINV